jgi:hypothetical protein
MSVYSASGAMILALALLTGACTTDRAPPAAIVAIPPEQSATPEFHDARIGGDTLRSRLPSDN